MLNVSLRCLEVFVAIAETGSFVGAADRLGITQPSVSDHVRTLETKAGATFFDRRRGRPAQLTEAGQIFLAHARTLWEQSGLLSEEIASRNDIAARRVRFAYQRPLAGTRLPQTLADFARDHESYELAMLVGNADEVIAQLNAGTADLGCVLSRRALEGLPSRVVGSEIFTFAAAPSHPLAGRLSIEASELAHHKFLRAAKRSGFDLQMTDMLAAAGIANTPIASRANESVMMRELAVAGVGILCTLRRTVLSDLQTGALVELQVQGEPMRMDVHLAYAARRTATAAARLLGDYIEHRYPTA